MFDLKLIAENEQFNALFSDPSSPVVEVMNALQAEINDERTTGEMLEKKRSRLAGMKSVHKIVFDAMEAQAKADEQAIVEIQSRQSRSRMSLPFLSWMRPNRTVPGHSPGRLVAGR